MGNSINESVKTYRYKIPKLKSNTAYKVSVRAYNTYKQNQYYNSKIKKWQTKKPAKKNWKGRKTKKVTKYAYGPASVILTLRTTKPVSQTASSSNSSSSTAHKHNYSIPAVYDWKNVYSEPYGWFKHGNEMIDSYIKEWDEEHEYMALSDDVYVRVKYWEERDKYIQELPV